MMQGQHLRDQGGLGWAYFEKLAAWIVVFVLKNQAHCHAITSW